MVAAGAVQAFAIIGILAISASTGLVLVQNLKMMAVPAGGLACFSFLITFGIMAGWANNDDDLLELGDLGCARCASTALEPGTAAGADCGANRASFGLFVVAWLLSGVHTALAFMHARDGK